MNDGHPVYVSTHISLPYGPTRGSRRDSFAMLYRRHFSRLGLMPLLCVGGAFQALENEQEE